MTFLLDHDTPDDLTYSLEGLGHKVVYLRNVLSKRTPDPEILAYANQEGFVVITCNRDDYLALGRTVPHQGINILLRKKTRVDERAALVHLLDRADDSAISNNINFA